MTQAQQSEAQRLAAICETKGMFPVAYELNRMHARILELEQGKCLHQIAEPVEYPHLPQSVADVVDFMGGGKVDVDFSQPAPTGGTPLYTADQMRAYVDADRTQRAAASQAAAHPDDAAVDALAVLMKAKLAKQRAKGCGGWDTDCTQERLSDLLRTHVNKGDPVDVANFCAFLAARGEMICLTDAELINAMEAHRVTEHQRLLAAAPALYVSPEQLVNHTDHLESEAGRYLPARKTAVGKFTMPLYAHPTEGVPAHDMVSAKKEDANAFCRILTALGMEEEGDPVAEVQRLLAATQPAAQGLDAARYHWLREQHDKGDDSVTIFIGDEQHGPGHLDAQIDEAIAAQAKQGGA